MHYDHFALAMRTPTQCEQLSTAEISKKETSVNYSINNAPWINIALTGR